MTVHGKLAPVLATLIFVSSAAASAQEVHPGGERGDQGSAVTTAAAAAGVQPAPAPQRNRFHTYIHDVLGPGALVGVAVGTAVEQVRNDPAAWGKGSGGLGRRLASTGGQLVAQETVRHGLASALGRTTEYERCRCADASGKIGNAFVELLADRNAQGRRTFSEPRLAGVVAGAFVPMLWWPGATVRSSATSGAVALAFTFAGNVLNEFVHWPN